MTSTATRWLEGGETDGEASGCRGARGAGNIAPARMRLVARSDLRDESLSSRDEFKEGDLTRRARKRSATELVRVDRAGAPGRRGQASTKQ